jgi:hypothetical protein
MMHPAITAYRQVSESYRLERLQELLGHFIEVYRAEGNADMPILALHDHKGCLFVNWSRTPTNTEVGIITNLWLDGFNEYDCNHYVKGRLIVCDAPSYNPFCKAEMRRVRRTDELHGNV